MFPAGEGVVVEASLRRQRDDRRWVVAAAANVFGEAATDLWGGCFFDRNTEGCETKYQRVRN